MRVVKGRLGRALYILGLQKPGKPFRMGRVGMPVFLLVGVSWVASIWLRPLGVLTPSLGVPKKALAGAGKQVTARELQLAFFSKSSHNRPNKNVEYYAGYEETRRLDESQNF